MRRAGRTDIAAIRGWPHGVNNRLRETEGIFSSPQERGVSPQNEALRDAVNVDLSADGTPMRRRGYDLQHAGFCHSLWSAPNLAWGLCVHEGWLSKLHSTGQLEALTQVQPYARMSYALVNDEVYASNGLEGYKIRESVRKWSLYAPGEPSVQVVESGDMPPGRYSIVTSYEDSEGQEYEPSNAVVVDAPSNTSVDVTVPGGWPIDAAAVRVYVSRADGEILYQAARLATPGSVRITGAMLGTGMELETQGIYALPPGHIVRLFSGRLWVANGSTLIVSQPLRYGLSRLSEDVFQMDSEVTLLEPSSDGVYVGTRQGGVVFLAGTDPYDMVRRQVHGASPVPGAVTRVPGGSVGEDAADVPAWWGRDGVLVAGGQAGNVKQLTKDRLALPVFSKGALHYREREGMSQVVSSLARGTGNSSAASDTVVATVRRRNTNCNR